jgi:preprotein translocase subunit SecG
MTEVLFILIVIIVAYVIYVIVSEQKTTSTSAVYQAKSEKPVEAIKQSTTQSAPKIEKVAAVKSCNTAFWKTRIKKSENRRSCHNL